MSRMMEDLPWEPEGQRSCLLAYKGSRLGGEITPSVSVLVSLTWLLDGAVLSMFVLPQIHILKANY